MRFEKRNFQFDTQFKMGGCCSKTKAEGATDETKASGTEYKIETITDAGQADTPKANGLADVKVPSQLTAKSKASSKLGDESLTSKTDSDTGIKSSLSVTSGSAISRVTSSRVDRDDEDMKPGSRASQAGSKASMALSASNTGSRLDSNYESVASAIGEYGLRTLLTSLDHLKLII